MKVLLKPFKWIGALVAGLTLRFFYGIDAISKKLFKRDYEKKSSKNKRNWFNG